MVNHLRILKRGALGAAAMLALAAIAWALFGWSTYTSKAGTLVSHRFFGRITNVDIYLAGARTPVEHSVYSWSEPYAQGDPLTSCAAIPPARWQDRNHDGRWDTWLERTAPDVAGECGIEYRVDTTGRGVPDWTFSLPYGQQGRANDLIKSRRGFP